MKARLTTVLLFVSLASASALAQRAKRLPQREDTGPVQVTRSATLQLTISSDAVGVFEYLADSKKLEQWFPDQAIIEPQLGGKYHFRWKDSDAVWSGVVTEFIRGNTLGFTWQPPGEDLETNVRLKVFPQGAETILQLTHSGFTSNEALDKETKAWVFYLRNLKSVIEDGTDLRQQTRKTPSRAPTRPRRPA